MIALGIGRRDDAEGRPSAMILSCYEKDTSPDIFFTNLYRLGYCVYDSEESRYFEKARLRAGIWQKKSTELAVPIIIHQARTRPMAPPGSNSQTASPSTQLMSTNNVQTKKGIVKQYLRNSRKKIVFVRYENQEQDIIRRGCESLRGLGYHVETASLEEAVSIDCDGIVCLPKDRERFSKILRESNRKDVKVGGPADFMPPSPFRLKMPKLSDALQEERERGTGRRR